MKTTKGGEQAKKEEGYCIAHKPLLFQPLRHWFTFIYRKHEHLAVEDFGIKDLHDSRGSNLLVSALLPSLCTYYSTLCGVCQEVFENFFILFRGFDTDRR